MNQILRSLLTGILVVLFIPLIAQEQKSIPHRMTEEEKARADEIGRDFFETDPPEGDVRPIAEYEPMESVLVRYPFGIPMDLIATMSEEILVTTIVQNESEENYVMSQYENNGVNTDNVTFIYAPTDSYWTRDYGPWYVEYGENEIGIVNFPYNRPRPNDNDIPIVVADSLDVELFGMDLIHTGGNYMADGVAAAASTTLVIEENPDYTVDEINTLMSDYMGAETYHLNEDPLGDYIEHIDCWGKFLDVDKILIGEVPEDDPRYEDFEAVADYYENATSSWGTPYEVFRVFTPGTYPETPYTNSLILNDRVFVPITGSEWDDEALDSWEEAMPGYEIIGIEDGGGVNWQDTDALHCRTHEMADRGMLKIKHTPLLGEVDDLDEHLIEAEIIPFSGEEIYSDSVKVYYKTDSQENYDFILMENTGGNHYEATIPAAENSLEISYYLHAADQSGRSENHPYIGAPDPHQFTEVGSVANIQLSQTEIGGACEEDDTATDELVIYNTGTANLSYNLEITYDDEGSWMDAVPASGLISPSDSAVITVTMDATDMEPGTYMADLVINSNDPDSDQMIVPATFNVTINTGREDVAGDELKLMPNPFRNNLRIVCNISGKEPITVDVVNTQGQLVNHWKMPNDNARTIINWNGTNKSGTEAPKGIYLIKIQSGNSVWIRKVQKL